MAMSDIYASLAKASKGDTSVLEQAAKDLQELGRTRGNNTSQSTKGPESIGKTPSDTEPKTHSANN